MAVSVLAFLCLFEQDGDRETKSFRIKKWNIESYSSECLWIQSRRLLIPEATRAQQRMAAVSMERAAPIIGRELIRAAH